MLKCAGNVVLEETKAMCYSSGPEALINSDLMWIALQPIKRKKIENLMAMHTIREISILSVDRLKSLGFLENEALKILSMFELSRRLEVFVAEPKPGYNNPAAVYQRLYPKTRGLKKERFVCLYLDTKNYLIREDVISIGSLNSSIVHPREVFKTAVEVSAASIILAHNHPSGDPTPSREDVIITEKLVECGKMMGIEILDHVIVGDGRYTSFKDEGLIH